MNPIDKPKKLNMKNENYDNESITCSIDQTQLTIHKNLILRVIVLHSIKLN